MEMKNPLAIIKVCSGLLQGHVLGDEEVEELLQTIQNEVKRVTEAAQNILERFLGHELTFSFWKEGQKCDPVEFVGLWVEEDGLRQSLNNLMINAFEAGSSWVDTEVHVGREHSVIVFIYSLTT